MTNIIDLPTRTITGTKSLTEQMECEICQRVGLAVYPARQTIVPTNFPHRNIAPMEPDDGWEIDPTRADCAYAVRLLRRGYVYLYYGPKSPMGPHYWEAYAVAENGALTPLSTPDAPNKEEPCRREAHSAARAEFLVIPFPDKIAKVWIAYSQDRWTKNTQTKYQDDGALRDKRMQSIEPKKWLDSPSNGKARAKVETPDTLRIIAEYATYREVVGEPPEYPHYGRPPLISNPDGTHIQASLNTVSTLYPWGLRNQSELGDPEPDIALHTTYAYLCASTGSRSAPEKPCVPMLLALRDPIGIAHELNGYRHNAMGYLNQYHHERLLSVSAVEDIEQISTLLQKRAGVMAKQLADASSTAMNRELAQADDWVRGELRPDQYPIMDANTLLMDRYRTGDLSWEEYKSERSAVIRKHTGDWQSDSLGRGDARRIEGRFGVHDAVRSIDRDESRNRISTAFNRAHATKQWEEKYRPKIDMVAMEAFKNNYETFRKAVITFMEKRSLVLGDWLNSIVLLSVLEDYDTELLELGAAYEVTVTQAISGLGADKVGAEIMRQLAACRDINNQKAMLWRAAVYNDHDSLPELSTLLSQADAAVAPIGAPSAAFVRLERTSGSLRKIPALFQKIEKAFKDGGNQSLGSRVLRRHGVDQYIVSGGRFLLDKFWLGSLGESTGSYMIKHLLQLRAGMDPAESSNLINLEVTTKPELRKYHIERYKFHIAHPGGTASASLLALADVERHKGFLALQSKWKDVASSARNPVSLAGLTGVFEIFNFGVILAKADKNAKDYGMLVASGLSMAAVYTTVATTLNKEFYGEASRSFSTAKAAGGALSGSAALIGVFFDAVDFGDNLRRENYVVAALYGVKSTAGLAASGGHLIVGLSYSAPLIRKIVGGGRTVEFITGLHEFIHVSSTTASTSKVLAGRWVAIPARRMVISGIGRVALYAIGWEVTLFALAVQGIIWTLTPNDLEEWCERNTFGKIYDPKILGYGGSKPKYSTATEQREAFVVATNSVNLASEEDD